MTISRWILLKITNVLYKFVEKIKTHLVCSVIFFSNIVLVTIYCRKYCVVRQAKDDNTIRRMRFVCCITKATDTHWEYILTAFPLQRCLRERDSMLRYTYIASLVNFNIFCALPRRTEEPDPCSHSTVGHIPHSHGPAPPTLFPVQFHPVTPWLSAWTLDPWRWDR